MVKFQTLFALMLVLAAAIPVIANAQDDNCTDGSCEDCDTCRNNNFYYVMVAAIILFLVFFYMRNKRTIKPTKKAEDKGPERTE